MARKKGTDSEDTLGIAVVGCGQVARAHVTAIEQLRDARLVACCDVDEERANQLAEATGTPKRFVDLKDVLADDEVDAVVLCLPHHLHCRTTLAAAKARRHVLCEKPMAVSLSEADRMIRAAQRVRVVLMVGQVLRFRKSYRTARQLISEGRIGEPRHVIRRRTGTRKEAAQTWATDPKQTGGWLLYGYGSHELDAILWLSDTTAQTVYAQARIVNPAWNDYDEIAIQMSLADGSMATMSHSLNANHSWWEEIVIGTKGSLYLDSKQIVLDDETIPITETPTWGMLDQYREFVSAIREAREPVASGKDVRRTMVALEAARLSIESGQPVDASGL